MLSREERGEGRRGLSLGFILSILVHATLLPLFIWLLFRTPMRFVPPPSQHPEALEIQSTSIRLEPKPKPRPPTVTHEKPTPVRHVTHLLPRRPPPRHELAVLTPTSPPQPRIHARKPSFSDELAAQEQQFARTAAKLHKENNPLSVATSVPVPSTLHRAYMDVNSASEEQNRYWAILIPTQHWFHGGLSCYYTTYHTQFGNGGSEEGTIPWPICYPRNADKMLPLDHPHSLPVPYPPPGWQLPGSDYITPWLHDIYDGRPQ